MIASSATIVYVGMPAAYKGQQLFSISTGLGLLPPTVDLIEIPVVQIDPCPILASRIIDVKPERFKSHMRLSAVDESITLMPHALIEIRRKCSEAEEVAMLEAVHAALVSAFRIPPHDKHVRLLVHEPHRFVVPPTLTHPELHTLVSIDCFAGRSVQAKRNLYAQIVDGLAELGIPRDHVSITVRDSERENWGIRGGQAACDVDLGFEVGV